ncbi:hypothetical protein MAR_ORF057 [Marseillevirus marseillevirus]|uniref:Uncharacterized protein n=1 Tax=Marseillevirus marseillevirus TaxID=694581 RepID=D2XA66_GBMV|nr:hypothetical protein MAR_ORF057 [Marseillevirus marseillevirus]ADB03843.1 hypothetical protein MAR_ORF057 [Marseillevirus marseillevirus]
MFAVLGVQQKVLAKVSEEIVEFDDVIVAIRAPFVVKFNLVVDEFSEETDLILRMHKVALADKNSFVVRSKELPVFDF